MSTLGEKDTEVLPWCFLCKALWTLDSKLEGNFNKCTCDVLKIYQCNLNCFWTPLIYYIIIMADTGAVALGCFIIRCGLMLGLQFDHLLFITFEILFSPGICILKVQILLDPSWSVLLLIDKPLFFFINLVRRKALRKWACGGQRNGVIWSATGKDKTERVIFLRDQKSPSLSPSPHRGKVNWNREKVKESVNLLRTNSTNLVLWTGSLNYGTRDAFAFLIYWAWPPWKSHYWTWGSRKTWQPWKVSEYVMMNTN